MFRLTSCNYNSAANIENEDSCSFAGENADCNGCLNGYYDPNDGSGCVEIVGGCTDNLVCITMNML